MTAPGHVNVGGAWKELVSQDANSGPPGVSATLEVWLDGSDDSTVTETGGNVTAWKNKGTAVFTLREAVTWTTGPIPLPTRGTINGHKSIHFAKAGITTPAGAYDVGRAMTQMTMFAVVHEPAATGGRIIHVQDHNTAPADEARFAVINMVPTRPFAQPSGVQQCQIRAVTGVPSYTLNQSNFDRRSLTPRIDEWFIDLSANGSTFSPIGGTRENGITKALSSPAGTKPNPPTENTTSSHITVGTNHETVAYDTAHMIRTMTGDIGEILLYNGKMTEDEKTAVRDYLSHKWHIKRQSGIVFEIATLPAVIPAYVNVGGAWKPAEQGWVNVAGVWKKVWPPVSFNAATGGTTNDYTKPDGTKWRAHTFTTDGTFTVTAASQPFRALVVAGGGAGGHGHMGGGGGAGAFLEVAAQPLAVAAHPIVVGAGGVPQPSGQQGGTGGDSKLSTLLTASGGGGGGCGKTSTNPSEDPGQRGGWGGSGGGSGGNALYNYAVPGGHATQGNDGGAVRANSGWHGSPGGGAGAVGGDTDTGKGGDGKQSDIGGTPRWYAGGGGGSLSWDRNAGARVGPGGQGGGGNGAGEDNNENTAIAPTAGTDGLGGGGGAGNGRGDSQGAPGGKGVVIIEYQIA
jgi:hypothetical protein